LNHNLVDITMTREEFGRYLLRELLWELEKFDETVPGLTDVPPEEIEVLSFSGYDAVRLRAASTLFDARLNWRADAAPVVIQIKEESV
jgi:hypothetical protein